MADTIESRKDAIAAAVASVAAPGGETGTETTEETKVAEKEKETPKEEKKATPTDTSAADEEKKILEEGKTLVLALRDPEKRQIVVDFLARAEGYTKAEIKEALKSEEKAEELTADIVSSLKESLGPEFEFLADKIGKGVEKYLNSKIEESQKNIKAQLQEQEREKLTSRAADTISTITRDFFGADATDLPAEVVAEMSKYMDKVPPSDKYSVKEYIEDSFHFAVGKLGITKTDKAKSDKINKTRNDASSRLKASERVTASDNIKQDSKPMSRRDAIAAAVEAVEKAN